MRNIRYKIVKDYEALIRQTEDQLLEYRKLEFKTDFLDIKLYINKEIKRLCNELEKMNIEYKKIKEELK